MLVTASGLALARVFRRARMRAMPLVCQPALTQPVTGIDLQGQTARGEKHPAGWLGDAGRAGKPLCERIGVHPRGRQHFGARRLSAEELKTALAIAPPWPSRVTTQPISLPTEAGAWPQPLLLDSSPAALVQAIFGSALMQPLTSQLATIQVTAAPRYVTPPANARQIEDL